MNVEVQFFAIARDLVGSERVSLELPDGATVKQLRETLASAYPRLGPTLERSMIAVDEEYASADQVLRPGSVVACIPPVSGGAA